MANETYIKHKWSNRLENGGYELSTIDGEPFDDRNARFAEGTTLAGADISGRSVREVFNLLKGNDSDYRNPSKGSYLDMNIPEGKDIKEHIYEQGYLAVWTLWCHSNLPVFKDLYKNSAGRTLTCYKTTSPYNPARAIADMFSGNFVDIDTERLQALIERDMPSLNMDIISEFPIRTAGMGEKRLEEFWNNVPKDTDIVIDTRKQRVNRSHPQFNEPAISNLAQASGMEYLYIKEAARLEETLTELAAQGKKVTVLTNKDWAYADTMIASACQHIEQTTDNRIVHIHQKRNSLDTVTQETLISLMLRPMRITRGDYLGIDIDADGNLVARPGMELRRHSIEQDPQDRIIEGQVNYGTPVTYLPAGSKRTIDAINTVLGEANYSIIGQFNGADRYTDDIRRVASSRISAFSLPTRPEDYDQEHIDRVVRTLSNKIFLSLSSSYERFNTRFFDIDNYKLYIDGANLARISNLPVEGGMDSLSENDRRRILNTGTKLDDISGITQDNVNAYIEGIIRGLKDNITFKVADGDVTANYPADDRYFVVTRKHYDKEKGEWYDVTETHCKVKVSQVLSLGDTGVGEAAIIAAQKLNLAPVAVHTDDYKLTFDNETLTGFRISDEASYKNRFSQGLRDVITLEQLQEQVEGVNEQRQHNIGLTDLQVLALYNLGMDNTSLVRVIEFARSENISITTAEEFESFIQQCHMSGLCPDTYHSKTLEFSLTESARFQAQWEKEGITFISAANILYPEGLKHQDSEFVEDYVSKTVIDKNGKETIVYEKQMVPEKYPAILFVKGNIALLNEASVTMLADYNVNDAALIKRFSQMAAGNRFPIVTPLIDGGSAVLVEDAVNSNGIVIGICADGFKDQDQSPEMKLSRLNQQLSVLGNEMVHSNVDDAVIEEYNRLVHEKTYLEGPAGKRQQGQYDREKGIVDNGGLLVSDKAPGEIGNKKNNSLFISKVAAGIGTVCAFIDNMSHVQPMNPIAMAAYSVYGIFKLTAAGMEAIRFKEPKKEKIEKKEGNNKKEKEENTLSQQQENATSLINGDYTTKLLPEVRHPEDIFDYAKMTNDGIKLLTAGEGQKKTMRPLFPNTSLKDFFSPALSAPTNSGKELDASWKLSQYAVTIIRSTASGSEPYYVVPRDQPQVESALRQKYGDGINVIYENEKNRVIDSILFGEVKVNGRMIPRYLGYNGTQRQLPEAYCETVYYYKGKIYEMDQTPKLTFGIDPNVKYNLKLWQDLVRGARFEQYNFQRLSGMDVPEVKLSDMDNVEYPQYHYENADHLVITPIRIEIRRGDEIRGVMSMGPDGSIHIENRNISSDDYQEYHETKTYDVFDRTGVICSEADVAQILKNINDTLITTTRDMTAYDESEKEDYEDRKATGWIKERMDNIEIAQTDWADGIRNGLIHDNIIPYDNAKMLNSVHCNINYKKAHIEALEGEYKVHEKMYASMEKQIELAREKMAQGATGKEYAALESLISKTSEEMLQVEQTMNGITLEIESDYLAIATLSDIQNDIRNSSPIEVVTNDRNETFVIYNGENVRINSIEPIIENTLNRSSEIWTCPPYHIEDIKYMDGAIKSCTIVNGNGEKSENVNIVADTVTIKGDHENIVFNILSGEQKKVGLSKGKGM